jgi:putative PIN family toxin of toxin-antitoxin system
MLTSPALLDELADVLTRPSPRKRLQLINKTSGEALSSYLRITTVLEPTPLPTPVCRDTDDDEVLALAAFAKADLIVSGDQDLLTLKAFEGIAILTVAQALERLEGRA